MTHLVGRGIALALGQAPNLNCRILFGKMLPQSTADISYLISLEDGKNLAKFKVVSADQKSALQIAKELQKGANTLHKGEDKNFKKSMDLVKLIPGIFLGYVIWFLGFLSSSVGVGIPALGIEERPFGSAMITSIGMMGVEEAYAPFSPYAYVSCLVLVGATSKKPVVMDDQLVIRPITNLMFTLDHRLIDGHQAALLYKVVREYLLNPEKFDPIDEKNKTEP